jgi:RNA polymerase sigma-70 factor (ECF subfamily)
LLGLGAAESDVQDLSQQVFLVLHRRLADFDGTSSMRTFIYGICLRVASEHRRRSGRRRERGVDELPERAVSATQLTSVATRQALERLERALELLPQAQREVFVLFEVEELSMAETARVVGCPLHTAYARLRRARQIIAAQFNEAWIAAEPEQSVGEAK